MVILDIQVLHGAHTVGCEAQLDDSKDRRDGSDHRNEALRWHIGGDVLL
jgi:hypothetical protein